MVKVIIICIIMVISLIISIVISSSEKVGVKLVKINVVVDSNSCLIINFW